jgi:hypothetical protein
MLKSAQNLLLSLISFSYLVYINQIYESIRKNRMKNDFTNKKRFYDYFIFIHTQYIRTRNIRKSLESFHLDSF